MENPKKGRKKQTFLTKAIEEYMKLLAERPVITKATTNAVVSAFGNIISQCIAPDKTKGGKMNWRTVFAYSSFGFFLNGPLMHHFYVFLEKILPKNQPNATIKRVIFDRLFFAPPFLLLFLYYISIVEGAGSKAAIQKIKDSYWMILKLNWTVWTIIQYININYVPLKFRILVGNLCGLIWMIFISVKRKQV